MADFIKLKQKIRIEGCKSFATSEDDYAPIDIWIRHESIIGMSDNCFIAEGIFGTKIILTHTVLFVYDSVRNIKRKIERAKNE